MILKIFLKKWKNKLNRNLKKLFKKLKKYFNRIL